MALIKLHQIKRRIRDFDNYFSILFDLRPSQLFQGTVLFSDAREAAAARRNKQGIPRTGKQNTVVRASRVLESLHPLHQHHDRIRRSRNRRAFDERLQEFRREGHMPFSHS